MGFLGRLRRVVIDADGRRADQEGPMEGSIEVLAGYPRAGAAPLEGSADEVAPTPEPVVPQPDAALASPPPGTYGPALAAATQLIAHHGRAPDEIDHALHRLLEQTATITGAGRVALWTVGEAEGPLALVAWTATDEWHPDEALMAPFAPSLPTLARSLQTCAPARSDEEGPDPSAVTWERLLLGEGLVAACPAMVEGAPNGVLAIVETEGGSVSGVAGQDELAACAALAGLLLERRLGLALAPVESVPEDLYLALPNHAAMIERLDTEIGRARRFEQTLALLVIDIDRFKSWSSVAGAEATDALLRQLTVLIRESLREVDLFGRGQEDSFLLLLPMSDGDDALRVGERIRSALAERQPETALIVGRVTVSGGAVSYPNDGSTAEELLALAEQTVAYAKRMGRDQIRLCGLGALDPLPTSTSASSQQGWGDKLYLVEAFQGLLDALAAAGEAHDHAKPGHSQAVGHYTRALAEACGLGPGQVRAVTLAGTLHDVGKIGLPQTILGKQGPLTEEERAVLREQPAVGKLILAQIPSLESVVTLVEHAQERYDGGGYPDGLSGDQIPFGARIIAIAEAYEAMTTDRPYRPALSRGMAVGELWKEAGRRYDPRLVDTFARLVQLLDDPRATPDAPLHATGTWNPELLERVVIDPGGNGHDLLAIDDAATMHLSGVAATDEAAGAPQPLTLVAADTGESGAGPDTATDGGPGNAGDDDRQGDGAEEEDTPECMPVDDTLFVTSETALLKMAALGRLNTRKTGYHYLDPRGRRRRRRP